MEKDIFFLERCLQLAQLGLGSAQPNPLVGAVITYGGKIIGEGWHQQFGQAHAEINAIQSVKNRELLKNQHFMLIWNPVHTMVKLLLVRKKLSDKELKLSSGR